MGLVTLENKRVQELQTDSERAVAMRNSPRKRWIALVLTPLVGVVVLAGWTNVPTSVEREDALAFAAGYKLPQGPRPATFEAEIAVIRNTQKVVFDAAPVGTGIPEYEDRELTDLLKAAGVLCFDRSRTLDKALKWQGFETRHVFLLFQRNTPFIVALGTRGHPSHAVTEVKTSRGWMLVDSLRPWIAVTRNMEPVSANSVSTRLGELDGTPEYLQEPLWAIRGLYSRRGQFYKPHIPFPDLSWPDFIQWMITGDHM